ncbi:hypothetical protein EMEDMD4_240121 [Sinorhizobium medicae]|uniref:Uncharacterized protein n=1 Tax=Sinorhizobium medicae TaxID=110321 RepID=A0A508WZ06_9HYPH|nr:hypothetical protein EMEDMD4_240121 [Sinorhizobium medicae]
MKFAQAGSQLLGHADDSTPAEYCFVSKRI